MNFYQAEAVYMDSDMVSKNLGSFRSIPAATRACQRHAVFLLEFQSRVSGVWKAQGSDYWYRITRLEE